ncbi:MAG: hypothetical protein R3E08_05010 [Thiotrichaceae bacterium]
MTTIPTDSEATRLTLSDITKKMRDTFQNFVDPRTGKNKMYSMVDAALSAFSIFFMQSPSFLEYQRTLEQTQGRRGSFASVCAVYILVEDYLSESVL